MIGKTTRLLMGACLGAVLLVAAPAQAATVNGIIGWNAPPAGANKIVLGSDESRQDLIDRVIVDVDGDGIDDRDPAGVIDVGDSLFGHFVISTATVTPKGGSPVTHSLQHTATSHGTANSEWTGTFQIEVTAKQQIAPGVFNFAFGPDAAYDTGGFGTMLRMYEDNPVLLGGPGTTWVGGALDTPPAPHPPAAPALTDGPTYWALGIAAPGVNAWTGTGPDSMTTILGAAIRLASSTFAISRTAETVPGMAGDVHAMLPQLAGTDWSTGLPMVGETAGTSNIGAAPAGSPWQLSDNTNFNMTIVPLPPAVFGGLGLMGLGLLIRRRFF